MTIAAPLAPSFRPDGSVFDLARPVAADIVWHEIAAGLSKIARFNGRPEGLAYSVAQHCVLGADALFAETGDALLAGYFLLHDAHEALFGDWPRPSVVAVSYHLALGAVRQAHHEERPPHPEPAEGRAQKLALEALQKAIEHVKGGLDRAIWQAAELPPLAAMPAYVRQVAEMDERMLRAEAIALFGTQAARHVGAERLPAPRLRQPIQPWGPMKAEEAWVDRLMRYLGIDGRRA